MPPDEPNDEERIEELPEDNQTPFSPAAPSRDVDLEADDRSQMDQQLDSTHPVTDTNIEREELYDEGLAGAAEASEPNAGNTVVNYHKEENDG
jgi:hypothetical protein